MCGGWMWGLERGRGEERRRNELWAMAWLWEPFGGLFLQGSGGSLIREQMTNWHVPSWGLVERRHDVMCKLIDFRFYDQEQITTDWISEWLKMTNIWYIYTNICKLLELPQFGHSLLPRPLSARIRLRDLCRYPESWMPTHFCHHPSVFSRSKKSYLCILGVVLSWSWLSIFALFIINSLKSDSSFIFWFWHNGWAFTMLVTINFFSLSYH